MKKLDRHINSYSIIIYFFSSLILIGTIVGVLWLESRQRVSVSISNNSGSTVLSTSRAFSLESVALLLIVVVVCILITTIVIQLAHRKKIISEISLISNEMIKGEIKPLTNEYTYVEFENIKNAYNKKINQIDEQVKRKDEYFNMTVHDLRVPIQAVKSNISLLEKFPNDSELIVDLKEDILRLESEVARYLLLEKIDYFERANLQRVEINRFIKELLEKYALDTCSINVNYSKQLDADIDKKMFEKIVINLVQNGIQNSPDSSIRINFGDDKVIFSNYVASPVKKVFFDKRVSNPKGNGFGTQIIQKYIKMQNLYLEECNTATEVNIIIKFKEENEDNNIKKP